MTITLILATACSRGGPTPTPTSVSPVVLPVAPTAEAITPLSPLPPGTGNPPVRVQVPNLGVDVAVRPIGWEVRQTGGGRTTEWQILPDAAGHHRGSANPGELGNLVLSGHNTPGGGVFEGLAILGYREGPLPSGLRAYITAADGTTFVYGITEKHLLPVLGAPPEQVRTYVAYIGPTEDARLTLVTCWPLGDTSYRLVLQGALLGTLSSSHTPKAMDLQLSPIAVPVPLFPPLLLFVLPAHRALPVLALFQHVR